MQYSYNGNQLRAVTDETNSPQGFLDGNQTTDDYEYDANGNLTIDRNKGITEIVYNHLNLPKQIIFVGGQSISYLYNALGQKIQKQVSNGLQSSITEYLSGFQYRQASMGRRISPAVPVLMYFPTAEGYVNWLNGHPKYVYNYTDHLGNIRLSYAFDENANMLRILEENNYYPFGLKHQNYNNTRLHFEVIEDEVILHQIPFSVGDGKYNKKFGSKDWQEELGLNVYDFEARFYDPALVRTLIQDPHEENHKNESPYCFLGNNPLSNIDPTGMDWYEDKDGNLMWRNISDETYKDDNGSEWKNVGTEMTFVSGNKSIYFGQKKGKDGKLTLFSKVVNFEENDTSISEEGNKSSLKNQMHSNWAREQAENYWDDPTIWNGFKFALSEALSQWTDPSLLVQGATIGIVGVEASVNSNIRFGKDSNQIYHAFRHIDEMGLSRSSVINTVVNDVKAINIPQNTTVSRYITVDGVRLQYNAHKLPNGQINIGRINGIN